MDGDRRLALAAPDDEMRSPLTDISAAELPPQDPEKLPASHDAIQGSYLSSPMDTFVQGHLHLGEDPQVRGADPARRH
jgi:hypothetical protein